MKNIRLFLQNPYCEQWQEATSIFLFKTKVSYFFIFYLYLFLFTRRKKSEAVLSEEPSTVMCLIRKNVFDFSLITQALSKHFKSLLLLHFKTK